MHELPFSVRLRPASAAYFDVVVPPAPVLDADGRITVGGSGLPLAALCILSRQEEGRGVELRRLAADGVIRMLLPHAYCFTLLDDDLKRKTVAEYLELAGPRSGLQVRFTATLDELLFS